MLGLDGKGQSELKRQLIFLGLAVREVVICYSRRFQVSISHKAVNLYRFWGQFSMGHT